MITEGKEEMTEVRREDIIQLISEADDQMLWSKEVWRVRDRLLAAANGESATIFVEGVSTLAT